MISVTKIFEVSYAHYLQDYKGKCSRTHGHNALIEIEISSPTFHKIDINTDHSHSQGSGIVKDFTEIKERLEDKIKGALDHKFLNEIPYFREKRPTAENLCYYIYYLLGEDTSFFNVESDLERIRVWEDRDSYAEWKRDREER